MRLRLTQFRTSDAVDRGVYKPQEDGGKSFIPSFVNLLTCWKNASSRCQLGALSCSFQFENFCCFSLRWAEREGASRIALYSTQHRCSYFCKSPLFFSILFVRSLKPVVKHLPGWRSIYPSVRWYFSSVYGNGVNWTMNDLRNDLVDVLGTAGVNGTFFFSMFNNPCLYSQADPLTGCRPL